jgi:type I restriction enzyme S subunit
MSELICSIDSICELSPEKRGIQELNIYNFISTENILPNLEGVIPSGSMPTSGKVNAFQPGDILFSNIRTYFRKVWYAQIAGGCSNDVIVFRAKTGVHSRYLYYIIANMHFIDYTVMTSKGTKMPRGDKHAIKNYKISLPEFTIQQAIAEVLSSIDDKIDLLNRQNETLEAMAQALFRQWFIEEADDSWEVVPITSIAHFLNGLACQKFPPLNENDRLPVLKIKDLKDGLSNSSDYASSLIDPKYIVASGDVIFSWSASLVVKLWDGQKCVLNQHLFKVTSDLYPKWFYYLWCKHHLARFISVANAHATTMGHVKRSDLDNALVVLPCQLELERMSSIVNPILEKLELNSSQISSLRSTRDALLPKLMSGEVRVKLD